MRREPIVLFDNGSHQCLCFDDLVSGEGVQSNQFLIVDNGQYLLLDPGGDLTYTPLSLELSKRFPLQELDYIFASHQDPDIIAALDKWLLHTRARGDLLQAVGALPAAPDGQLPGGQPWHQHLRTGSCRCPTAARRSLSATAR
ncbi:flavoprotein [Pseudomonas aeruginosa]|nr:flavoprotein [Pseudomonas aeruginosa]